MHSDSSSDIASSVEYSDIEILDADVGDDADQDENQQEINGRLTEEQIRKQKELEKSPMQAELKHLEKRWTKRGQGYIAEPQEEEIEEAKANWYEKFALCVSVLVCTCSRDFDNSLFYHSADYTPAEQDEYMCSKHFAAGQLSFS